MGKDLSKWLAFTSACLEWRFCGGWGMVMRADPCQMKRAALVWKDTFRSSWSFRAAVTSRGSRLQISQTSGILCAMIYTVFVIRILLIYSKIIKYICIMESSNNLGFGTLHYLAYRYLQSDPIGVHLFICGETMVQQRNRVLSFPNHPHRCGFTTNVSVDSWSYW